MGIEYLYEPQGFILSDGNPYLPDFYLPEFKCFVEVKGLPLNGFDYSRAETLVEDMDIPLLILDADPGLKFFTMIKSKGKLEEVNIVPTQNNSNKFLANRYLNDTEMFKQAGYSKAIEAVSCARHERF